jgi:hypothetical protein
MQAIVDLMRTPDRDLPSVEKGNEARDLPGSGLPHFRERSEKILTAERRQPIEKSRFGGENSRKRKKKQGQIQGKARNGK